MKYEQFTKYVDKLRSFGFDVFRNKSKGYNYAVFTDGANIGEISETGYNQDAINLLSIHKPVTSYGSGFIVAEEVAFSELTKELAQETFHKVPKNFGSVDYSKIIKYSSFDEWIEKSGFANQYDIPLYAYSTIVWNDAHDNPENVIIKIGATTPEEDDKVFYEAESIDEIKNLTKKNNGEDFRILKLHISYRFQPVTPYVKEEPVSSIIRLVLTEGDLEFLSEVFHEYKDCHRGEKEAVLKAMELEDKLSRQTNGKYVSDTTYDIKD